MKHGRLRRAIGIPFALAALLALASCDEAPPRTAATATATPEPTAAPTRAPERSERRRPERGTALAALDALAVKGRAPRTGYDRDRFGSGWVSVAGCDMHERILMRDLRRESHAPGETCDVRRGRLADPYTATAITYIRGGASEVDVDHVVALGDAWQKGAQQWSYARRVRFANDPLNLLAVDAAANRQKGDGDAATWLPANKPYRCRYVARQIAVKRRYRAWVTRAEHDAMGRVLARCPSTRLPAGGGVRALIAA